MVINLSDPVKIIAENNIPDYQSLMLPLLKIHSDNKDHNTQEIILQLLSELRLPSDIRTLLLESSQQPIFDNRMGWARTYLKKAGLIESVSRGITRITARGAQELLQKPQKITVEYLQKYPEFNQFKALKHEKKEGKIETSSSQTPQERMESAYKEIKASLISELLEKLKKQDPTVFENTVLNVLKQMGYGSPVPESIIHTGKTGDGGIDGIIKEDYLGLDEIYVQAKRWNEGTVGRPEIDKFIGALTGKSKKGVFITTSSFSEDAIRKSKNSGDLKIILIDGEKLAELMIKHNVGVYPAQTFEFKKIDSDFFNEE